jgi:regulator of nucleoside diphosphate kinase
MLKKPKILITSVNMERIENFLNSANEETYPGLEYLEEELERATVVEPKSIPPSVVTMNSTVRFAMEPSGEEFCMTLVYPGDEDSAKQKISVFAPVGSALLGLAEGDKIEWPRPGGGRLYVHVQEVLYQPEKSKEG